jgi:hypothetical protein
MSIDMNACWSKTTKGLSQTEVSQLKQAGEQTENLAEQSPLEHIDTARETEHALTMIAAGPLRCVQWMIRG